MALSNFRTDRRVYVVEDDALYRAVLVKLLEKAGFVVQGFDCGANALVAIESNPDAVLLLDQQLPDMSGDALISALSTKGIKIPFIIMTGQGNERLAADMIKLGAADYLVKDHDLQDILPEVVDKAFRTVEVEHLLRSAEEALRESERRFRQIFSGVGSVAIRGFNADGTIVFWNSAAAQLYGYTQSEAIGESVFALLYPEEDRAAWEEAIGRYAQNGGKIEAQEIILHSKAGAPLTVRTSHVLVRARGQHPEIFALDVDLTSRKQAEQEREALRTQLAQAQKMESVGRLAGGVAHDFNNLLGAIYGNCDLGLMAVSEDSEVATYLQEIQQAAQRSAHLTQQLLAYARKQVVTPSWIVLAESLKDVLGMLDRLIGENISLQWEHSATDAEVFVDPTLLEQILTELCLFSKDKVDRKDGCIAIATTVTELHAALPTPFELVPPGRYAVITIDVSGPAVPLDDLKNLFDPFYGADPRQGFVDLGLATVYGMVRQSNGYITASIHDEEKLCFEIYFVLRERGEADKESGASAKMCVDADQKPRILFVEDDASILKVVATGLERAGYSVLKATSPLAALELLKEGQDPIELLITDVIMPEMNGCDLADEVQKRFPDIRCLFVSGYTDDVVAKEGGLAPGFAFLQKPFTISKLKDAIAKLFREGE